ncbi:neuronal acetylcholine receptor subunit beta-3-like isoform X2 [Argiope bruennichi]|uniref:neuronal acetylcholine receptor subunit beta-3-like isoform X2 n=1 Tax=Argiope bruennichi TaxID=94029 RepID=UPI0024947B1D|nr:neuronal acetylcholine receptor subunit beta-3-like isoform X2 [Argiope bruennichi]
MTISNQYFVKRITQKAFYCVIYFFVVSVCPAHTQVVMEATPASELKRLRENLLLHYDKIQRPTEDGPTSVLIYFDVRHVMSLDEKFQTLTVEGVLMMKWKDERLKWDPSNYNNIKMLRMKIQDIWVPDIYSLFSVKKNDLYKDENVLPVQVYSNGTLKWYPPTVFDVPCSAKYKHYPFDSHNCSIVFGAWTHNGFEISLETLDIPISSKSNAIGTEWLLTNLTHENEIFDVDGYHIHKFVRVGFYLQRTSTIYRYVCVVPTIIVFVTSLAGFWLLPSDGARYLIGCSNVVLMSLLLQYLAMTVHAGSEIPLIAQYSATCLCMSGVFLVITTITEIIRNCSGSPPNYLVRLACQHMDQYLCLFSFSDSPVSRYRALGEVSSSSEVFPEEENRKKNWMVVSLVVDRIAFWIFTFVYIVLLAVLASL